MSIDRYQAEDRAAVEAILAEADAYTRQDLLYCLDEFSGCAFVLRDDGALAGVSVFTGAERLSSMSFLIAPPFRGRGLGTQLLAFTLEQMREAGVCEVFCDYQAGDARRAFMESRGFTLHFQSRLMSRETGAFLRNPAIVPYTDGDYERAASIAHEAFHRMRVGAGIQGSTLDEPSEEERRAWAASAPDRFVWRSGETIVAMLRLEEDEIATVAVDVALQGRGYGRQMVRFALDELHRRGHARAVLWCVEGNPARQLYEELGFVTKRLHDFMRLSFESPTSGAEA